MLTPEKLSSYEFNKVTEIYNQLNIDISALCYFLYACFIAVL